MLVCFISIKCYDFFQSSSLRYTCFQIETYMVFLFLFLHLNTKYLARSKIKLIETDLSFPCVMSCRIVKTRVRQGEACYEVEWHKPGFTHNFNSICQGSSSKLVVVFFVFFSVRLLSAQN